MVLLCNPNRLSNSSRETSLNFSRVNLAHILISFLYVPGSLTIIDRTWRSEFDLWNKYSQLTRESFKLLMTKVYRSIRVGNVTFELNSVSQPLRFHSKLYLESWYLPKLQTLCKQQDEAHLQSVEIERQLYGEFAFTNYIRFLVWAHDSSGFTNSISRQKTAQKK